ncbi:MAG: hypothetical protein J2P52_04275 [Blastocatellia bacterium]|nr:hypothetical protein [Blastocatellia bacterium]
MNAFTNSGAVNRPAYEALTGDIERQLQNVLDDFNAAPSRDYLFEAGAIAEIAILGRDLPSGRRLAAPIGKAAADWARRGLLEEVCFSETLMTYHASILLLLAGEVDWSVLQRLSDAGMIGRSEWPVLTQLYISATFRKCGIVSAIPGSELADFTARIDKRCLRASSTEYDLALLLMVAQLAQLGETDGMSSAVPYGKPRLMPQLLLTQALRWRNLNWLPVLVFLCRRFFSLSPAIEEAARRTLGEVAATPGSFDTHPDDLRRETEYFSRTARSLRIRSATAFAFYLDTCME